MQKLNSIKLLHFTVMHLTFINL